MPWTVFLILGTLSGIRRGPLKRAFLIPAVAAGIFVGVVSLVRFKFDHYFVPAYPFLAILGAQPLARVIQRGGMDVELLVYRVLSSLILILVTFLLCTPISLSPESFPALMRFMAIIQTYGNCEDRVLYVEGGQPYGSFVDYEPLIAFYTGRHTVRSACNEASALAERSDIGWILVSGDNIAGCIGPSVRNRFKSSFKYGSQTLLSRIAPASSDSVDLSPLMRELRVATDCKPGVVPPNPYISH